MKSKTKSYEMDLSQGSIVKKMFLFALPIVCSGVLQLLFGAMDIIVVGHFAGDNSLAAVGANGTLIDLLTMLFIGISIGANVIVAREYGANNHKDISEVVHTAIPAAIISGGLLIAIGMFLGDTFLRWMATPEEIFSLALTYLKIYFLGAPAMMVYNFGSAILRAIGDTRRPLYYLMFSGVLNVLLNLLFVIVFQMDVAGVATATVISQIVSAVLIVRCLMKEKGSVHLELEKMRIRFDKLREMLIVGIPAGIEGSLFSIANVAIQSTINSFGAIAVSGNTAAANLEGFILMTMMAFGQAVLSFMSQNIGARKYDRIKKIYFVGLSYVLSVGFVIGFIIRYFGEVLLKIYSSNPEVIEAGMKRISIMCVFMFLWGIQNFTVGALRGIGYSLFPTLVSVICICGLRIVWIVTVCQMPKYHNITMVYISYPVSWISAAVILVAGFVIGYKRKIVRKKELIYETSGE